MDGDSFADRLDAARAGDRLVLGQVLEVSRRYLLQIATAELPAALRSKSGASDLVQETLLEAYRSFGNFRGRSEGELRGWLRRVLLFRMAKLLRHYRTARRDCQLEAVPAGDAGPAGGVADPGPSPVAEAVLQEEAAAVSGALERLPAEYRQVLVWRLTDGVPFDEIGRRLGRTGNAARLLWLRAFRQLKHEAHPEQLT